MKYERRRDLFTAPPDEKKKPALCGFLPMSGWPHKWARKAHLDSCDECARAESNGTINNLSKKESRHR